MISKVVSNSSHVVRDYASTKVAYVVNDLDNQIIFSANGILYMRSDRCGMRINKSLSRNENGKKSFFNKSSDGIELLFELNTVYVKYVEEAYEFKVFCFNFTEDGSVIYTEISADEDDFLYEETENYKFNYEQLCEFLYGIDEFYEEDNELVDTITGKFILTDGVIGDEKWGNIAYVNFFRSGFIYKSPISYFSKRNFQKIIEEVNNLNSYSYNFHDNSSFLAQKIAKEFEENKKENYLSFSDRILENMKENMDDSIDESKDLSSDETYQMQENKISLTGDLKNYLIMTAEDEGRFLNIYEFSVFCLGEDNFEIQYRRINLDYLDDAQKVFFNLKLK